MNPKVSIIMGIYNCADTLPAAIDSILNQTYTNWELIMCDDGSKDETYEIAKGYVEKYPDKLILIRNEKNMRLAATLNHCLLVATGEYIARMDADDESMPLRLEKEVEYLNEHQDYACVGTGSIVFDENGDRTIRVVRNQPDRNTLIYGTPFMHPTIMMRKSVYDALGGYTVSEETMRAEDLDLWFRFYASGYNGHVIQEPLYRYRESIYDFKKRSLEAAIGTSRVYIKGYKKLGFGLQYYPYAFKPILSALLPNQFMYYYHKFKDNRK